MINFYSEQKALAKGHSLPQELKESLCGEPYLLVIIDWIFVPNFLLKCMDELYILTIYDTQIFKYPLLTSSYQVVPALYTTLSRSLSAGWVDCSACNSKQCFPISLWVAWKPRTSTDWTVLLPREAMKATKVTEDTVLGICQRLGAEHYFFGLL